MTEATPKLDMREVVTEAISEALTASQAPSNKAPTYVGGSLLGALLLGLLYFGQGQLERLDKLDERLGDLSTQMAIVQAQVQSNASLKADIEAIRTTIREHERDEGHPKLSAKVDALATRVTALEGR